MSEMAKIRNLHWWTVEYGLIGSLDDPKIYGAGLLSSIGESKWCMQPEVTKLPYTLEASEVSFDITKPQPQLFVTPDFAHLSLVLEQFANKMALRTGGLKGVEKLIDSNNLGTVELSTGIQISGVFTNVISDENNKPIYIQTTGPTALANRDKELISHGVTYHAEGYGSPVGKLKGINIPIENMSPRDLEAYGIYEGKKVDLEFEGGVKVSGEVITGTRDLRGHILLVSFKNCTVTHGDTLLFHPDWGIYDMAVGVDIVSAYAGPADVNSFGDVGKVSETKTHKISYSESDRALYALYDELRVMRSSGTIDEERLNQIFEEVVNKYQEDWLLPLELYEVAQSEGFSIATPIRNYLEDLKSNKSYKTLLENGLHLLSNVQQV